MDRSIDEGDSSSEYAADIGFQTKNVYHFEGKVIFRCDTDEVEPMVGFRKF